MSSVSYLLRGLWPILGITADPIRFDLCNYLLGCLLAPRVEAGVGSPILPVPGEERPAACAAAAGAQIFHGARNDEFSFLLAKSKTDSQMNIMVGSHTVAHNSAKFQPQAVVFPKPVLHSPTIM